MWYTIIVNQEIRRMSMDFTRAVCLSVSESVTEAITHQTDAPPLSAEDGAIIFGLLLCVLLGFVLSFFILSRIKRK